MPYLLYTCFRRMCLASYIAVACITIPAMVSAAPREPELSDTSVGNATSVEEEFTTFPNGAVLDGIVFRKRYIAAAPQEDCIVLTFPEERAGINYLGAVTLYTKNGAVFVHGTDGKNHKLSSLKARDLVSGDLPRLRQAAKSFLSPQIQVPRNFNLGSVLAKLVRVEPDKPEICGLTMGRIYTADNRTYLAFDWNGNHHKYDPAEGVSIIQLPKDQVTGKPYVCLPGGDFIELVIFGFDYLRQFPSERVELVFDQTVVNRQPGALPVEMRKPIDLPCAAYTKNGELWIFSTILGHFKADTLKAVDISDIPRLHKFYTELLAKENKVIDKDSDKTSFIVTDYIEGDSDVMPLYRAYARLQKVYNECDLRDYNLTKMLGSLYPKQTKPHRPSLLFQWKRGIFICYGLGGLRVRTEHLYEGTHEPLNKNRVVEGICMVTEKRQLRPNDHAVFIPYLLKGSKLKTSIVWTENGKLFGYNNDTFESIEIPYPNPDDITNPSKFGELAVACDRRIQVLKEANHAKIRARSSAAAGAPWDASQFSVDAIAKRLIDHGVTVIKMSETKERNPDGSVDVLPLPSAVIEWAGKRYTYGPDFACVYADGVVLRN